MLRKTFETSAFVALILVAWVWVIGWASNAFGQSNNANTWQTPGNQTVGGIVDMCINGAGLAIPCSGNGGIAPGTSITAVFSGADTTTAAATLAAAAGKTTYICGFNIGGLGATAATIVSPTVGTVAGGNTLTYAGGFTFAAGATVADTPFNVTYSPCIPANAVNSAIAVTVPGAAGNTSTTINAWGFQL